MKYFEDIKAGDVAELPARHVSEADIIDFATKYDPQTFHTDPEAAKQTAFGGLAASGWHTNALLISMLVERFRTEAIAATGSPGVESCRWLIPVRPGDTLTGQQEVLETWPSKSKPIGFVRSRTDLRNQHGKIVMTTVGLGMVARRPEAAA